MGEFSKEGVLTIGKNVLYNNLSKTALGKILTLQFHDPNGYILTVSIFDWATKNTILLYQQELDGGDTLTDELDYVFNQGDQLIVETTSASTSFYIHGMN